MLGLSTAAVALPPPEGQRPGDDRPGVVSTASSIATTAPGSLQAAAEATTVPASDPTPADPTLPDPAARRAGDPAAGSSPSTGAPTTTASTTTTVPTTTTTTVPTTTTMVAPSTTTTASVASDDAGFRLTGLDQVEDPPVAADDLDECRQRLRGFSLTVDGEVDRNAVAQLTYSAFLCVLTVEGLDRHPPEPGRGWDPASWRFTSLAEQAAAEAVVVGYCESIGFDPDALFDVNPWGYGGLFQMGSREMRQFGPEGGDRLSPADNAVGAATYFVWMQRRGGGWGGWGPWAVVNTNFNDEVNDRVKVPVLPRFASTDPDYRGRRGAELPAWAVDPWSFEVPEWNGCPTTGGSWPEAQPLER